MDTAEAAEALSMCTAYDNRTPSRIAAEAWSRALSDITLDDAKTVIVQHYTESREWIMPADVRNRVKELRRKRHDEADKNGARLVAPPESIDPDDVAAVVQWRKTYEQGLGDGLSIEAADARACELIGARRVQLTARPEDVKRIVAQVERAMPSIPPRDAA